METFFDFTHFLCSIFLLGYVYSNWQQGKEIARLKSELKDEQTCFVSERKDRQIAERELRHQLAAASDFLEDIKRAVSNYEINTKPDT
jgi:hypothetical protein